MTQRQILLTGTVLGLLAVALGAFGAHALKPMLTAAGRVDTYELAVRYQFYHAFALLATGLAMAKESQRLFRLAGGCFLMGVVLFSGSLYTMAILQTHAVAWVTPVGGLFLLAGWALLAVGVHRMYK